MVGYPSRPEHPNMTLIQFCGGVASLTEPKQVGPGRDLGLRLLNRL